MPKGHADFDVTREKMETHNLQSAKAQAVRNFQAARTKAINDYQAVKNQQMSKKMDEYSKYRPGRVPGSQKGLS